MGILLERFVLFAVILAVSMVKESLLQKIILKEDDSTMIEGKIACTVGSDEGSHIEVLTLSTLCDKGHPIHVRSPAAL